MTPRARIAAAGITIVVICAAVWMQAQSWSHSVSNKDAVPVADQAVPDQTEPPVIETRPTTADFYRWKLRLAPLHRRMDPPQPGDWLERHRESGQTFEQYQQQERQPRIDGYTRIAIVPIGSPSIAHQRIVERTAEYLSANFGLPVEMLTAVSLDEIPQQARREDLLGYGEQLLTSHLLQKVLPRRRPADALAVLGMTTFDLWPGDGWNFVFGQASLSERVGVWSLARYGNPEESEEAYRTTLRRTIKVALHETGHMVGIRHCVAYNCGMNGSNHLQESDRQPVEFCPECQAKLWWTCRYDPRLRLQRLAGLAHADGLLDAAEFWDSEAIHFPETESTTHP